MDKIECKKLYLEFKEMSTTNDRAMRLMDRSQRTEKDIHDLSFQDIEKRYSIASTLKNQCGEYLDARELHEIETCVLLNKKSKTS